MIGVSSTEGPLYQRHGEGCYIGEGCQLVTWEVRDQKDLDAMINWAHWELLASWVSESITRSRAYFIFLHRQEVCSLPEWWELPLLVRTQPLLKVSLLTVFKGKHASRVTGVLLRLHVGDPSFSFQCITSSFCVVLALFHISQPCPWYPHPGKEYVTTLTTVALVFHWPSHPGYRMCVWQCVCTISGKERTPPSRQAHGGILLLSFQSLHHFLSFVLLFPFTLLFLFSHAKWVDLGEATLWPRVVHWSHWIVLCACINYSHFW